MNSVNFSTSKANEFFNSINSSTPEGATDIQSIASKALSGHLIWSGFTTLSDRCADYTNGFPFPVCNATHALAFGLLAVSTLYIAYRLVQGRCEHSWKVNGKEIRLVSKFRPSLMSIRWIGLFHPSPRSYRWMKLESQIIDTATGAKTIKPFSLDKRASACDAIKALKRCEVILNPSNNPHYTEPVYTWKLSPGQSVSLVRGLDEYYWTVRDPRSRSLLQASQHDNTTWACPSIQWPSPAYIGTVRGMQKLLPEDLIEVCKSLKPTVLGLNFLKSNKNKLSFRIKLTEKTVPSHLDSCAKLTYATWAVTMILTKGKCSKLATKANCQYHAQIVAEGMRDGKHFLYFAHHNTLEIDAQECDPKKLKKDEKSETFLVPAYRVKNMIKAIEKEKGRPYPFSYLGKDSIFGGAHNCVTWCMEKLKIVEIRGGRAIDYVAAIPYWNLRTLYAT